MKPAMFVVLLDDAQDSGVKIGKACSSMQLSRVRKIFSVNNANNITHQFENTSGNYKLYKIKIKKYACPGVLNSVFVCIALLCWSCLIWCTAFHCCVISMRLNMRMVCITVSNILITAVQAKKLGPRLDGNVEIMSETYWWPRELSRGSSNNVPSANS